MATKIKTQNTVYGKVFDANGSPLANIKVEIYDIDMRAWQLLADTTTDREGKYELIWTHSQLKGRGTKEADIAVKVLTKELNTELFSSSMDEVRFNASEREEINITIRQDLPKEVVEFDFLVNEVTFLSNEIAIADLQESSEHRDVTFLSKELEIPSEKIEHLIVAHRLMNISKIDAAFFYALFRMNTLLHSDFIKNFSARLSIGIDVDDQILLYDAALTDHQKIQSDIKTAMDDMIISAEIANKIKTYLKLLESYRKQAEDYYNYEHTQKVISQIPNIIKDNLLPELEQILGVNQDELKDFLETITKLSSSSENEKTRDKLIGFGVDDITKIATRRGIEKSEDIKRLARLNKTEWVKELADVRPDMKDDEAINTYSSFIVRKMEMEFPTIAFAAQLERAEKPVLKNQDKIVSFLNKYEDFDLEKNNVDLYLKEKKIETKDADEINEELKSVQRVFKLVPNYSKAMALRDEKIYSALSIVSIGKTRFVNEIAHKTGLSEKEANDIYIKAENKNLAAMMIFGEINGIRGAFSIASFDFRPAIPKIEQLKEDFPNLKTLFSLIDNFEVDHCRSVYSPAAYLVEILQFIKNRDLVAKSVLFTRRPDLGEIDLGCENANTPVKYIDLVCEILENEIAPDEGLDYAGVLSDGEDPLKGMISNGLLSALTDAGLKVTADAMIHETESSTSKPHYLRDKGIVCKIENNGLNKYKIYRLRQTFGSAEELDAAPEYVNDKAYKMLRESSFAFKLPFDLYHTEAKEYFNRFDVNRSDLMKAFQCGTVPQDAEIAAEILGLTEMERNIIVKTPSSNNNNTQQRYWNVPTGTVLSYLKRVDHFLDKTGLSYKELDLLLKLKFIEKSNNLYIKHNDITSADTATKEIVNLDINALDRMHRFLRLQKKTGIKLEVLDEIISQKNLGNGILDDNCLIKIAQLNKISEKTKIKIEELIGCFGKIPYAILTENKKPLYHQIFLNKAKNGVIDDELLPENITNTSPMSDTQIGYLATCIQLKQKDLNLIIELLPDKKLTFSNLSFLFAASKLMTKLKCKAEDFSIIRRLSGIDFSSSPENTLAFLKVVEDFKNSPVKATDIEFLLNHKATNIEDREIKIEKIEELLCKLKKGYKTINEEQKSKFNDSLSAEEQKEVFQAELSKINGINEEDVIIFTQFIDSNWDFKWINNSGVEIENTTLEGVDDYLRYKLADIINIVPIGEKLILLNNAFINNPDSFETEKVELVKVILDEIARFQILDSKKSLLEQTVSTGFKINLDTTGIVLKYIKLKQPANGDDIIYDLLSDNFIYEITPVNYEKQYAAIKLLHKMAFFLNASNLSRNDLEWYLKNNANTALGWFEPDRIPYKTEQIAIPLSSYLKFAKVVSYAKLFTPIINPLDAEQPISFFSIADLIKGKANDSDEFFNKMAILTGYEKADLDAIDKHLFTTFDIANYKDIDNWEHLFECADFARKLSSEVSQINEYTKPVFTITEVNNLRSTLKSRYDEDTWLSTLKEIMDNVRPQKRNALIAYLLATSSGVKYKDENEMYEHFLIDVEMESGMPSSRIVLAHNSIQLFVQRCLMGLESKVIADIEKDPGWNQWQWMKNYRVWEANRKVFLYPENWYDVTLTDDKTFLLKEFIDEIQQNELTNDTAEEAIKKYLEKLDDIAFLEVMATWYDVPTRNMHVFARTKGGEPYIYYYRRFESERYWSPWEKVELDITGDHLLAFMRNNRLCLAWPIYSDEPESNPTSTEISTKEDKLTIPINYPKKKLKIQLAISEYANKKWKPKKVSSDYIHTPHDRYADEKNSMLLMKHHHQFIYHQFYDQIWLILKHLGSFKLVGSFNITGCKGYLELNYNSSPEKTNSFLPKFSHTEPKSQHYEEGKYSEDDLSVKNAIHPLNYLLILGKTPGKFKISFPHQFTGIDIFISMIYKFFDKLNNNFSNFSKAPSNITIKNTIYKPENYTLLGSMLPYFFEDSKHAYVIIPGFYYSLKTERKNLLFDFIKRTASDVFQLFDDFINWFEKNKLENTENNEANWIEAVLTILKDPEFQNIIKEISNYDDILLKLLLANNNTMMANILDEFIKEEPLKYGEQFKNMYHPLVCPLRSILYKDGIPGLMKRDTQLLNNSDEKIGKKLYFDFIEHYSPNCQSIPFTYIKNSEGSGTYSYPIEDIDFDSDGSYSAYNWDLFFRVPLHIATTLTQNQRFEEALTWFHYMFNPTGALSGDGMQKYWVTKPFYLHQKDDYINQRIDSLMYAIANKSDQNIKELEFAIDEWRKKPFRPDVIARFRPVAYQKALLMKYLDNLIEWGDYLFRQDTMESIAQATQMYILADKLLGPKPRVVPTVIKQPYETYNQLEAKIDYFGNALIELENILPDFSVLPEGGAELPPPPLTMSMLYFSIPPNEKMGAYWDTVADRLFKIRHCQNIDGVERSMALFAPPIDPGMLVRAAASGLDLSSIIAGLNAPTPYYRFNALSAKASELAQEVRSLGSSLLQTLEKKDSEALTLLRNELELKVLNAVTDIKKLQIAESKEQIEVLNRTRKVTKERQIYYSTIKKINEKESLNLDKLGLANDYLISSQIARATAGALRLIPEICAGGSGFGGSPHVVLQTGGASISGAANIAADILSMISTEASYEANKASINASYERRYSDWKLQERLATKELDSIDKQIRAAEFRKEISEGDLKNHVLQIENAKKTDEFMRSKYTNKELYDWMIGQISAVYFKSYKLAHDFAKKAEMSYKFELGNDDSFISYGYWDSMKKGLQSADLLIHDIKRMETSYLDKNKREYEITKHVSLVQLDPLALVRLRATGVCDFEIPEALYDMDHPGQYFRRLKSVSVSLPCVAGPYTSVSAKLSLVNNRYRKITSGEYAENLGNDSRFVYNIGAIQSIATSNAQNDSGVFELNFRDERFLPFENTGAISSWRLELPTEVRQFDYNTISDVIVHVKYTAREGGSGLKNAANGVLREQLETIKQGLKQSGMHVAVNMKHDMPNEWHLLKNNGSLDLTLDKSRLPYMAQHDDSTEIEDVIFIAKVSDNPASFTIEINGATTNLSRVNELMLCKGSNEEEKIILNEIFNISIPSITDKSKLEELLMIVKYKFGEK